ncbi:MAG: helix-turn-helix domain-containing protein [Acidimicrobiia bacterium]
MSEMRISSLNEAAAQIRSTRRALGLSQEHAARAAGFSVGTWSLLERGLHRPKAETAIAICRVLGWSDDALGAVMAINRPEEDHERLREFGARVRARRIELGLSRDDAALNAGISASGWQHLERGRIRPRPHTAEAIARVLGWDVSEFDRIGIRPLPPTTPPRMNASDATALREIGRKVRARRKELGLTQVEAATRAGISNATWSPLERGKIRPVWRTAVSVARVLGWPDDAFAAVLAPRVDTPTELVVDLVGAERREPMMTAPTDAAMTA